MPRIKIGFTVEAPSTLALDYNYSLYLGLRRILFAFLNERQPRQMAAYKKELPPFTFSQLMIPRRRIELGLLHIESRFLSLQVSSPESAFLDCLIQAFYLSPRLKLLGRPFTAHKVEVIEEPGFADGKRFRMLSPLVLLQRHGNQVRFIGPEDGDLSMRFAESLSSRMRLATGAAPAPSQIHFALNAEYLREKRRVDKLITLRGIHYKAIMAPFSLQAPEAALRFAYQAGIGDKNAFGFGMIETATVIE
jgi:CRISPR-associated endoribonuclease Cas6